MKTLRRQEGEQTYFVFADVEPAYEEALRSMQYPRLADGFGRAFPNDTPNLDRIYRNFERVAEAVVLQAAGAQPVPWEQALLAFLPVVENQAIDWWVTGSTALAARGMDIAPRDIDLVVGEADSVRLGTLLLDHLYEPVTPVHDWICSWWGRAFLHARFEWAGGVNDTIDQYGISDAGPTAARRLDTIAWRGWEIRVPPLDLQRQVSQRRGLVERVQMIDRWLEL